MNLFDRSCEKSIKEDVKIIKDLTESVFLVEKNGEKQIMKVITYKNHPWAGIMKGYSKEYLLRRVLCNYKIFETIQAGQYISSFFCTWGNKELSLVLFLEYLPIKSTEELIEENEDKIKALIEKIHSMGIYHGDLHGGNIGFDENMNPVIIDLDTVFYEHEITGSGKDLPSRWAKSGFDMDVRDVIKDEKENNWRMVPE